MAYSGPQRRHHVLLSEQLGNDAMETLCNIIIIPHRNGEGKISHFTTQTGYTIQCLFDERGVSCNTCQHVWRNTGARNAS